MASEIDALFSQIRARDAFSGGADPFDTIHQTAIGSNNPAPAGWYAQHDRSSAVGQRNLVYDPTFQTVNAGAQSITAAETFLDSTYQAWAVKYVLNSGTAPTNIKVTKNTANSPFSTSLSFDIDFGTNACDIDVYLYPGSSKAENTFGMGWMGAAAKIAQTGALGTGPVYALVGSPGNVTSVNLYTQVLAKAVVGGALYVYSTSPVALDLLGGNVGTIDTYTDQVLDFANPTSTQALWRFKLSIVKPAGGTAGVNFDLGEPQLFFNWTPDPLPATSHSHVYGDGTGVIRDDSLLMFDSTTNNVSTTAHGFAPKAPSDATKFLDGTGAWSAPIIPALTTAESFASADVTITTAGTWYNGPSITLAAGTWLILVSATVYCNAATGNVAARIWDGTTTYAEGELEIWGAAADDGTIALSKIITTTGSKTFYVSATASANTSKIKAANNSYSIGNYATSIRAVKVG